LATFARFPQPDIEHQRRSLAREVSRNTSAQVSPDEYRDAVLGSSTHSGHIEIDALRHRLIFKIDAASYPNWEGTQQIRDYTFQDDTLTYSVPASASGNGTVAYSIWQRR
jgi:hypothetical protein